MKSLQLQNLRTKALVCKARFLSPEVETDGHVVVGTKGWFSDIRARSLKNKATCGLSVGATTGKAH